MGKKQVYKLFGPTNRTMHTGVFAMICENSPNCLYTVIPAKAGIHSGFSGISGCRSKIPYLRGSSPAWRKCRYYFETV